MSEATDSTFRQKLQALQQKYLQRLTDRIAEIEETWRIFCVRGNPMKRSAPFIGWCMVWPVPVLPTVCLR